MPYPTRLDQYAWGYVLDLFKGLRAGYVTASQIKANNKLYLPVDPEDNIVNNDGTPVNLNKITTQLVVKARPAGADAEDQIARNTDTYTNITISKQHICLKNPEDASVGMVVIGDARLQTNTRILDIWYSNTAPHPAIGIYVSLAPQNSSSVSVDLPADTELQQVAVGTADPFVAERITANTSLTSKGSTTLGSTTVAESGKATIIGKSDKATGKKDTLAVHSDSTFWEKVTFKKIPSGISRDGDTSSAPVLFEGEVDFESPVHCSKSLTCNESLQVNHMLRGPLVENQESRTDTPLYAYEFGLHTGENNKKETKLTVFDTDSAGKDKATYGPSGISFATVKDGSLVERPFVTVITEDDNTKSLKIANVSDMTDTNGKTLLLGDGVQLGNHIDVAKEKGRMVYHDPTGGDTAEGVSATTIQHTGVACDTAFTNKTITLSMGDLVETTGDVDKVLANGTINIQEDFNDPNTNPAPRKSRLDLEGLRLQQAQANSYSRICTAKPDRMDLETWEYKNNNSVKKYSSALSSSALVLSAFDDSGTLEKQLTIDATFQGGGNPVVQLQLQGTHIPTTDANQGPYGNHAVLRIQNYADVRIGAHVWENDLVWDSLTHSVGWVTYNVDPGDGLDGGVYIKSSVPVPISDDQHPTYAMIEINSSLYDTIQEDHDVWQGVIAIGPEGQPGKDGDKGEDGLPGENVGATQIKIFGPTQVDATIVEVPETSVPDILIGAHVWHANIPDYTFFVTWMKKDGDSFVVSDSYEPYDIKGLTYGAVRLSKPVNAIQEGDEVWQGTISQGPKGDDGNSLGEYIYVEQDPSDQGQMIFTNPDATSTERELRCRWNEINMRFVEPDDVKSQEILLHTNKNWNDTWADTGPGNVPGIYLAEGDNLFATDAALIKNTHSVLHTSNSSEWQQGLQYQDSFERRYKVTNVQAGDISAFAIDVGKADKPEEERMTLTPHEISFVHRDTAQYNSDDPLASVTKQSRTKANGLTVTELQQVASSTSENDRAHLILENNTQAPNVLRAYVTPLVLNVSDTHTNAIGEVSHHSVRLSARGALIEDTTNPRDDAGEPLEGFTNRPNLRLEGLSYSATYLPPHNTTTMDAVAFPTDTHVNLGYMQLRRQHGVSDKFENPNDNNKPLYDAARLWASDEHASSSPSLTLMHQMEPIRPGSPEGYGPNAMLAAYYDWSIVKRLQDIRPQNMFLQKGPGLLLDGAHAFLDSENKTIGTLALHTSQQSEWHSESVLLGLGLHEDTIVATDSKINDHLAEFHKGEKRADHTIGNEARLRLQAEELLVEYTEKISDDRDIDNIYTTETSPFRVRVSLGKRATPINERQWAQIAATGLSENRLMASAGRELLQGPYDGTQNTEDEPALIMIGKNSTATQMRADSLYVTDGVDEGKLTHEEFTLKKYTGDSLDTVVLSPTALTLQDKDGDTLTLTAKTVLGGAGTDLGPNIAVDGDAMRWTVLPDEGQKYTRVTPLLTTLRNSRNVYTDNTNKYVQVCDATASTLTFTTKIQNGDGTESDPADVVGGVPMPKLTLDEKGLLGTFAPFVGGTTRYKIELIQHDTEGPRLQLGDDGTKVLATLANNELAFFNGPGNVLEYKNDGMVKKTTLSGTTTVDLFDRAPSFGTFGLFEDGGRQQVSQTDWEGKHLTGPMLTLISENYADYMAYVPDHYTFDQRTESYAFLHPHHFSMGYHPSNLTQTINAAAADGVDVPPLPPTHNSNMQIKLHHVDTEDEYYQLSTIYSNTTKKKYGNVHLDYSGLRMGTSWKGPPGSGDSVFLKPYGFEYWEKAHSTSTPKYDIRWDAVATMVEGAGNTITPEAAEWANAVSTAENLVIRKGSNQQRDDWEIVMGVLENGARKDTWLYLNETQLLAQKNVQKSNGEIAVASTYVTAGEFAAYSADIRDPASLDLDGVKVTYEELQTLKTLHADGQVFQNNEVTLTAEIGTVDGSTISATLRPQDLTLRDATKELLLTADMLEMGVELSNQSQLRPVGLTVVKPDESNPLYYQMSSVLGDKIELFSSDGRVEPYLSVQAEHLTGPGIAKVNALKDGTIDLEGGSNKVHMTAKNDDEQKQSEIVLSGLHSGHTNTIKMASRSSSTNTTPFIELSSTYTATASTYLTDNSISTTGSIFTGPDNAPTAIIIGLTGNATFNTVTTKSNFTIEDETMGPLSIDRSHLAVLRALRDNSRIYPHLDVRAADAPTDTTRQLTIAEGNVRCGASVGPLTLGHLEDAPDALNTEEVAIGLCDYTDEYYNSHTGTAAVLVKSKSGYSEAWPTTAALTGTRLSFAARLPTVALDGLHKTLQLGSYWLSESDVKGLHQLLKAQTFTIPANDDPATLPHLTDARTRIEALEAQVSTLATSNLALQGTVATLLARLDALTGKVTPFAVQGYYPLYHSSDDAAAASPSLTYHTHYLNGAYYYMPDAASNLHHGTYT